MLHVHNNNPRKSFRRYQKAIALLLASLILLYASSGCSWKYAGSFRVTEKTLTTKEIATGKHRFGIVYDVQPLTVTNQGVQAKVLENRTTYEVCKTVPIVRKVEYKVYYNPTTDIVLMATVGILYLGMGPIIAPIVGIAHETSETGFLADERRQKLVSYMKGVYPKLVDRYRGLERVGGMFNLFKLKAEKAGTYEAEGEPIRSFFKPKEEVKNKEARGVNVSINPKNMFRNQTVRTSWNGTAVFQFAELPYNIAFSRKKLEEKLKSSELASGIKAQYRINLLDKILRRLDKTEKMVIVATCEDSTRVQEVKNDSSSAKLEVYEVPEEKIYGVLEDFIRENINSKIHEVRIRVKDESTHTPVLGTRIEIKTTAPTKSEVAKKYFEGDLLKWAVTKIKDYVTGQETLKYDANGVVVFSAYVPNNYKTETTHPKSRFVNLNFDFSDLKLKKTIYMSKDPKLIKIVDE